MEPPADEKGALQDNLESWNDLANLHAQGSGSRFYRIEQWLAGETKLAPWEIEEIGPVVGKSLLHLQCHIGTDTLSWSREGAKVTGLDFSPNAVKEAVRFARLLEIEDARFVVSSVSDAIGALGEERFDIVYTGRGALCWLPDIREWASICSHLVKSGGILYLEESTPMLNSLEPMDIANDTVFGLKYDLYNSNPVSEMGEGSYADPEWPGERKTHCWEYRYDTIINALIENGFRIDLLNERDEIFFEPHPGQFIESRKNYWTFKEGDLRFPLSFTLKATRL
tara:strand:- start:467 stop:1312 length:846 start_codon:yes stop_codon:yes gene_type:complete